MIITKIIAVLSLILGTSLMMKAQDIDNAKLLIENERYSSAEVLLEKNISSDGPEPEINYLLLKTYLEQDKTEEANKYVIEYLGSASSTDVDPLNRIAYARYLLNTGEKKAAEEIFTSIINNRKNQKNPPLLLSMAEVVIEEKNGDAREALNWLDMAERKDKHNPEIDIVRGIAYRKLGDASNAFLSYQNAINKDPSNAKAYYLMGKIFTAQKNPDVYMEHFGKAYEIDSTYAPVLEELYKHYYFRDVRIAKRYLEKYIANTDYYLQNDYYWTDILYLNSQYQEAIKSALSIIDKEQSKSQPRLYKLIAYSSAKSGDSAMAFQFINEYFAKGDPAKVIAADFQLIAQLTERLKGQEEAAIAYYSRAADIDTITTNRIQYATAIAALYKRTENFSKQASWLGKLYEWKEKANNVDLFNWGLAYYMSKNYQMTDSVFSLYTTRYPDDIYGYYWRAQANASIDTTMAVGLAIPFYLNVIEIGEQDKDANKKILLKAYGYLGGYEANITKDYATSLKWFQKYLEMDEKNADVAGYIEMLRNWMAERK